MILSGFVKDKNNTPAAGVTVELKGQDFATLCSAESDENGYYRLDADAGRYPFLTAVKDYGENFLEYWCQNIPLTTDLTLDISFDKIELYGLHVFSVKGAGSGLMAYFRPMSLEKFLAGESDIAPEDFTITVTVDGRACPVLLTNKVKEIAGEQELSAYLIQVDAPESWHKFEVKLRDSNGNYGAAAIFS